MALSECIVTVPSGSSAVSELIRWRYCVHSFSLTYSFLSLVFMYLGRRLGWALSKNVLYPLPEPTSGLISIIWGGLIALAVRLLIEWQHPHVALKIIFGFMLGAYVAIPNFGLFNETTIPPEAMT